MARKAIFLDIDETLLAEGKGPFPADVEKIIEARKRGHKVIINTGRSQGNMPPSLRNADYIDGYVFGAGAHVILDGKTLACSRVDDQVLVEMCAFYLARKKWCAFEGEANIYCVNRGMSSLFSASILPIKEMDAFLRVYPEARITKITIPGTPSEEERSLLEPHFTLNQFEVYFEGIIKGANKARGMKIVLKALGIPLKDSIAIGDSMNDLGMISAAGTGIAMGNACDAVKKAAKYVTGSCDAGGVGEALERWVLA